VHPLAFAGAFLIVAAIGLVVEVRTLIRVGKAD